MNPRAVPSLAARGMIFLVLTVLLGPLGGCIVTESALQKKLESFESQMRSSSSKGIKSTTDKVAALDVQMEKLERDIKALQVSVTSHKTDLLAIQGNMGKVFEAAEEVKAVRKDADVALSASRILRKTSEKSVSDMNRKVEDALKKYREMMLEEKRILSERIRFLNASLRKLDEDRNK